MSRPRIDYENTFWRRLERWVDGEVPPEEEEEDHPDEDAERDLEIVEVAPEEIGAIPEWRLKETREMRI